MSLSPRLEVDLDKIRYNSGKVVEICHRNGIAVLGVTKGVTAIPEIVAAMIEGGVDGLADARMENIIELKKEKFNIPITLLRIPRLSNVEAVVKYSDVSVNSEISVIQALGAAAVRYGFTHSIILMVDLGDLREGIMLGNVLNTVKQVMGIPGVKLVGLGTNMGCFGGVLPEYNNLNILVKVSRIIESKLEISLEVISGGGTSTLLLVENNTVPSGVNQLRVGEGILLGSDTTHQRLIQGLYNDAFTLKAEVIEVKAKPSIPFGTIGKDAFGNTPEFIDMGIRTKAICAIGKQDAYIEGIKPIDEGVKILGASSDHLILDITDNDEKIRVGDELAFQVTYAGLLSVSQSKYVHKVFRKDNVW